MTPKEKAEELIEAHFLEFNVNETNPEAARTQAHRTTLITINEVLTCLRDINGEKNMSNWIDWWKEVKEEFWKIRA